MNIYDMVPGKHYLFGDSLGYDLGTCVSNDGHTVIIKLDETGTNLDLFEEPGCGFSTYVEER
jgi:hypothetical protein